MPTTPRAGAQLSLLLAVATKLAHHGIIALGPHQVVDQQIDQLDPDKRGDDAAEPVDP